MKKTLLITEEERKRISILHENAIKRQHLSEQAPPQFQYNAAQMLSAGNQNTQNLAPVTQADLNTSFINKTNQQYVNSGNNTAADSNTSTNTTTTPDKTTTTTKGNSKVQEIQKKLIELGYGQMLGPKKDDGVLGKNTYNAILSALSTTPKLTTNTVTNQPNQAAGTTTSSSSSGGSTTPAASGGSTTPAASGGSTTPAAGTTVKPAAAVTNTPSVNTNAPIGKEEETDNYY